MLDDDTPLEFVSEDELPEQNERKPVPDNTVALVQVRAEKDRELGDFRNGQSEYGPWMIVPFEVAEGEFKGEWASIIISVKPTDRKFRAVFEAVTGVDISSGGSVTFAEFKNELLTGVFEAVLGPEKRKGELTGYTTVNRLNRRVRERDAASAGVADVSSVVSSGEEAEEDIPF